MDQQSNLILVEALNRASLFLKEEDHAAGDAQNYWMYFKDWSLTDLVTNLHEPISKEDWTAFQDILERIVQDEPIQYILGYADFYDRRFKVTSDTLIPREETTGIIDLARDLPAKRILDIGTGTGIIGITMALENPEAAVLLSDISAAALAVAKENAEALGAQVELIQSDVFDLIPVGEKFDLILSNPPYISQDELDVMGESVKKFEPKSALFAENNGLAIYEKLAATAPKYLTDDGVLIVEIGYRQGGAVKELFSHTFPEKKVEVLKDFNELDRFVRVS